VFTHNEAWIIPKVSGVATMGANTHLGRAIRLRTRSSLTEETAAPDEHAR